MDLKFAYKANTLQNSQAQANFLVESNIPHINEGRKSDKKIVCFLTGRIPSNVVKIHLNHSVQYIKIQSD